MGAWFSRRLRPPVRGAAVRQNKLSPLKEMTARQLETYSATQLATVLLQHERAVDTAICDRHGLLVPADAQKLFLEPLREECTITLCPNCGRAGAGEDQSSLSIDGVLKGDIPPSAAVGYGFRGMGGRPVADVNVVKTLGLRDPASGSLPRQLQKFASKEHHAPEEIQCNSNSSSHTDLEKHPSADHKPTHSISKTDSRANFEADMLAKLTIVLHQQGKEASAGHELVYHKLPASIIPSSSETNEDFIDLYSSSDDNGRSEIKDSDADGGFPTRLL